MIFTHLFLLRSEEEIARSIPAARSHTPPADPESNPRAATPEPEGSKSTIHFTLQSLTHLGHWVFTPAIQGLLYRKTIPFYIRDTHESADRSLQQYEKATGRTIPEPRYNSPPKEGEVILNVVKRGRSKQISVHPRHLVPWEPVVGGEVVVIKKGSMFGVTGVVSIKTANQWVVTFSVDNDTKDYIFEENELAALEAGR